MRYLGDLHEMTLGGASRLKTVVAPPGGPAPVVTMTPEETLTVTVSADDFVVTLIEPVEAAGTYVVNAELVETGPVNIILPVLEDDAIDEGILTTSTGLWGYDPDSAMPSITYQWLRDGSTISGEVSQSYTIGAADAGADLSVEVTATNANGARAVQSTSLTISLSMTPHTALFAGSEIGFVLDPSDLSTLWTDTSRTIQVAGDGDFVRAIDDKSPNAIRFKLRSGTPPTYRTSGDIHWLEFPADGAQMEADPITGLTSDMDYICRVETLDMNCIMLGTSLGNTYIGHALDGNSGFPANNAGTPSFAVDGTTTNATRNDLSDSIAASGKRTVRIEGFDPTAANATIWANDMRLLNTGATNYFEGNFYGAVLRQGLNTDDIAGVETWLARKAP